MLKRYPGTTAVEFIRWGPQTELEESFIAARQREGSPDFPYPGLCRVHRNPSSQPAEHFVTTYAEPPYFASMILGIDVATEPRRKGDGGAGARHRQGDT